MVTLIVSLETLLQAKQKGKGQKLELDLEAPLTESTDVQSTKVMDVQYVASRYHVSLKGLVHDQIERMCKHVHSLGYETVNIQVGDFPFRGEFDRNRVNINFIGIEAIADTYEFRDFLYDAEETMEVRTGAITFYTDELGVGNNAISPIDLYEKGTIGYSISASITDRLDGSAEGVIILNSNNRKIAEEVHAEVLSALRNLYQNTKEGDNASTTALKQVCETSKNKDLLKFHQY